MVIIILCVKIQITVKTVGGREMIKHIRDNNTTYYNHFIRAMSMSLALFVHAWLPSILTTYASDKMNETSDD